LSNTLPLRKFGTRALSGLPAFLVEDGGLQSGMLMTQTAAAALVNETRTLAVPSSTDSIPTSADQEDHVSMGAWGGWKARLAVENCARVLAIELACACEALEFLAPVGPSPALAIARDWVRQHVAKLEADRSLSAELDNLATALGNGELLQRLS
jgi:histidine ammonia-lyase